MPATKVVVNIPGESSYDVRIGLTARCGCRAYCRKIDKVANASRVLVITDDNVAPLYLDETKNRCAMRVTCWRHRGAAGEGSKSLVVAGEIWEAMASLSRLSMIARSWRSAAGSSAIWRVSSRRRTCAALRWCRFRRRCSPWSIRRWAARPPSTWMWGKNLVGTFKQPAYVCASTRHARYAFRARVALRVRGNSEVGGHRVG